MTAAAISSRSRTKKGGPWAKNSSSRRRCAAASEHDVEIEAEVVAVPDAGDRVAKALFAQRW
jgi:hypothetical protein